jgi:hypothetical protein
VTPSVRVFGLQFYIYFLFITDAEYSKVPLFKNGVITENILDIPEADLNSIVIKARLPSEKQIIGHKTLLLNSK